MEVIVIVFNRNKQGQALCLLSAKVRKWITVGANTNGEVFAELRGGAI